MPFNFVTTVQWRAMTKSRTGAGTGIGVTQPLYVITNESDYHYLHECDVTMLMLNAGSYTIQFRCMYQTFSLNFPCPTGHYMYLETSQPARPGDSGGLSSPVLHFMGKQCIRFYVHASGNDTRRLNVNLYEPAKSAYTLLKKIEGKQPNAWMPVNIDVEVAGDYKVTHLRRHLSITKETFRLSSIVGRGRSG